MMNKLIEHLKHYSKHRYPDILIGKNTDDYLFVSNWLKSKTVSVKKSEVKESAPKGFCSLCPANSEKREAVGSGENGIMIIMNEPELFSKIEKQTFKNDADSVFENILSKALSISKEETYITHLVKCIEIDSKFQRSRIMQNCINHLREEITSVNPHIILVMGDFLSIKKLAMENRDISWFSIAHPLIMAKNPSMKKEAWITLKTMLETMKEANQ